MKKFLVLAVSLLIIGSMPASAKKGHKPSPAKAKVETRVNNDTKAKAQGYWITICGDRVRIRATPSLKGKILGHCYVGNTFWCVGTRGDWFKVKYGKGYGWVNGMYVLVEP